MTTNSASPCTSSSRRKLSKSGAVCVPVPDRARETWQKQTFDAVRAHGATTVPSADRRCRPDGRRGGLGTLGLRHRQSRGAGEVRDARQSRACRRTRYLGPLIWLTLRRAVAFLVLVILTIIEEVVVVLFHSQSIAASLGELFGARLLETLVGCLIMLLVLIPFFVFRVLSEALGEGRLERMFFVARESSPHE
jgi:hypothetical protein